MTAVYILLVAAVVAAFWALFLALLGAPGVAIAVSAGLVALLAVIGMSITATGGE